MKKYYHHAGYTPRMDNPYTIYNVFDRTRSMLDIPEIECLTPIGKLVQPKSIEELCYDSAKHIVDKAGTKKIVVTWSGGIDSTLVLAEILKIAPKSQIVVMMDHNSILEYPEFYKKYIEGQLEIREMSFYNDDPLTEAIKDGVLVTGNLMDPVFGENIYQFLPEHILKQSIPEFFKPLNAYTRGMYQKLIDGCPRPIVNVKDFFWWTNYALCYQTEQLLWLLEVPEMALDENLFHFPSGTDWNNYAVSTSAEEKWPGYNYVNYKQVLKDQIFTFTKDEYYTKEKIKLASWRRYRTNEQRLSRAIYIDTNWERGYLPPTLGL